MLIPASAVSLAWLAAVCHRRQLVRQLVVSDLAAALGRQARELRRQASDLAAVPAVANRECWQTAAWCYRGMTWRHLSQVQSVGTWPEDRRCQGIGR